MGVYGDGESVVREEKGVVHEREMKGWVWKIEQSVKPFFFVLNSAREEKLHKKPNNEELGASKAQVQV